MSTMGGERIERQEYAPSLVDGTGHPSQLLPLPRPSTHAVIRKIQPPWMEALLWPVRQSRRWQWWRRNAQRRRGRRDPCLGGRRHDSWRRKGGAAVAQREELRVQAKAAVRTIGNCWGIWPSEASGHDWRGSPTSCHVYEVVLCVQ
jgi:hypothetical protein